MRGLVFTTIATLGLLLCSSVEPGIAKPNAWVSRTRLRKSTTVAAMAASVVVAGWFTRLPMTARRPEKASSAIIGTILASAFPAIVVYAQELLPGKVGMISGLFFGLAFGTAGIAAALLGELADYTSIAFVYRACAFMPLLGLLTSFLPDIEGAMRRDAKTQ